MAQERKLAAIMFTDIVGFTSLMGESEKRTFEIININRKIHQRFTEEHGGKIVKELGDGILCVFENGTSAVHCAIDIQNEAREKEIPLRIGIHEGEVIVENNDIFGDGVNIASRLQATAAPGGVCISDSVYRIIRNKEEISVGKIGMVSLKNVKEPITLYQLKTPGLAVRKGKKSSTLGWILLVGICIFGFLIGIISTYQYLKHKNSSGAQYFSIILPDHLPIDKSLNRTTSNSFAISPDGEMIVYAAKTGQSSRLIKRPLNSRSYEPIPGTENGESPFFSPDGKWIGFYAGNSLKKVSIKGGEPILLCYAKETTTCSWLPNDSIIYGGNQLEGMKIIHSSGGEERVLTHLDLNKEELMHSYPYYIQGEEKVLYARESISDFLSINVLDLKTGKDKELVKGASKPYYLEDGYLTYSYEGSLFACPYDPDKNVLINEPLVIIDNTREESGQYYIQYAVSEDGTLVYMDYEAALGGELVEVDPEGTITPIDIDDEEMLWVAGPKYSPDGRHLAYWKAMEGGTHVWIYDFSRGQHSRFTSTGTNAWPIWTPDGSRIAFPSIRGSSPDLNMYIKSFVSNTPSEAILKSNITQQPKAWSNNEKLLLYHQQEESDKGWGVYMLNMETGESSPFLNGDYDERIPDFSPDDKWVVYESNETGIFEIFVTDFPEREMKYQISLDGGNEPMWSHKGNRIIYRKANGFYEVQVNMENEDISFVRPKLLFSGSYLYIGGWGRNYDLSPDESRIVTVRQSNINDTRSSLQVITNFPDKIRTEIGGD